tara:strand:+ start:1088 stop:2695 length:1608 start_codon:yes stop_codon:yes gene_type:complete
MFVFVSDLFVEDYVGGGELTTAAIIEASDIPIKTIRSNNLTRPIVDQYRDHHWIFGNFSGLSIEMILYCCKNLQYSVIEYDYKYCSYRLPEKHIKSEGHCNCEESTLGKVVSVFFANAKDLWFMSASQRDVYYDKFPFLKNQNVYVLSSVFNKSTLDFIKNLDCNNKNDTWLIQKSDSWVKGTEDCIKYANDNNLKYELFSGIEYAEMLKKFSQYKGFIFLPAGHDTCPRTVIEAKLLGCDLILNDNVQHKDEEWFSKDDTVALDYLSSRASFFWQKINQHTRAQTVDFKSNKKTHFKIIVPVYNSESWIRQVVDTIKNQKYKNFECVISNDQSTDKTWEVLQSLELDDRFKINNNKEKKFALKNIYDSILQTSPNSDDVIVILDGDDWFSTPDVLSTLNEYYSEDCLVTYGSFVTYPSGDIGHEASEYPQDIVSKNDFRQDVWRASHLKTFKYSIWNMVNPEDLQDDSGCFYEISYDQAMMLPMLELAGPKAKYIPEILYVYNVGNPNAVNKTRAKKQYETMLKIRKKQRYKRL